MKYPKKQGNRKAGKSGRRPLADDNDKYFFEPDNKRRRRDVAAAKEEDDDDELGGLPSDDEDVEGSWEGQEDETLEETVAEKRYRIAKEQLDKIRAITEKELEEEDEDEDEQRKDQKEGRRDSLVSVRLRKAQDEESGRSRRILACRVLRPESHDEFQLHLKHRQSVTAVSLQEDESRGFSASKDGMIMHWDVETGKAEKYLFPDEDMLRTHGAKAPQNLSRNRSKVVLGLAVSSDNRYLASGGCDRHVHLWDIRTHTHIQAFPGHRDSVSCLAFKSGSSLLFSGSFDRTIKMWNSEDRTFLGSLFGHQSQILTMDCTWNLERECLLTVGRDRTMRLWKVQDESQLVFRAPASSLESCCMINASEYMSGSDDGSIELWSIKHKKPTHIIKNAHAPIVSSGNPSNRNHDQEIGNGILKENGASQVASTLASHSWVGSVSVCKGSDLAASGAANGVIRLWAISSDNRGLQPLYDYPVSGFVNSLAFAKSGRFIVAGVGKEPRLGRWGHIAAARNGIAIHSIRLQKAKD